MFGEFKVHAGDFDTARKARFVSDSFSMPKINKFTGADMYLPEQVKTLEMASEESVKRIGGTAGWGLVGVTLFGGIGLLAGLLAGGRGKDVTFVIVFEDGKKALCTADSKMYTKMQAALMKGSF
ncbi:hypothetical protein [Marinobacter alexandrii]|uniref:hypothetical protein n=1 Tax=Marinobacter alexandrii TaxID=2570351 RepID=UPI001109FDA0|nr:hypothetical protein [Marinobacter alexandrii]